MINTGFTIPNTVLKRLAAAVAAVHRDTAPETMAEMRKAYRERSGPTLGCFVHVDFTQTGAVKSFHARPIAKSTKKFRPAGFEADVPLFGRADFAAKDLARDCAEFLLRREIDRRRGLGQREFVELTDHELSDIAQELSPLKNWPSYYQSYCGSLSEQLRLRLVEGEIELRRKESNHQRLPTIAKNKDFVTACKKRVEAEKAAAKAWREEREASPYYHFSVSHVFESRSDEDQTVIAYRDAMGWRP
ncbi:MAG: hypothetical protein V2I43_15750 [Parvularcula sp.]|nr:hypothetical protein [Parvularcula sp.]